MQKNHSAKPRSDSTGKPSSSRALSSTSTVSLREEIGRRRFSERFESIIAVLASIAIILVLQGRFSGSSDDSRAAEALANSSEASSSSAKPNVLLLLSEKMNTQWSNADSETMSDDLLLQASEAVAREDDEQFAKSMTLLGANALRQHDAESAAVYLEEALAVFEDLQDELGIANVELLRGEMNLEKRARARRAGLAYDALQLAGWKVANGQFHDAVDQLNHVINENLALDRYGAAAGAYQTLYKGYEKHGQTYEAQQAGIEIVKLHASSGRPIQAQAMLNTLLDKGLDPTQAEEIKQHTLALQIEYEDSVKQLSRASDYQQLYHHFINAGDPVRAWQFRLKSQRSLQGVSKLAMHRRQTGVLALLYTSNDHMKDAERSLTRASRLFSENAEQGLSELSTDLRERIY